MVSAHSGALAAADGGWEALARGYGVHRVGDLAELADTLDTLDINPLICGPHGSGRGRPGHPAPRQPAGGPYLPLIVNARPAMLSRSWYRPCCA